jgi:IS30 family transposase
VPREISVGNAKQFDCHILKDFCQQMRVKAAFASVYHPWYNGAVEKANALIYIAIMKKGKWAEELLRAVWSHNTSARRVTKFTPLK